MTHDPLCDEEKHYNRHGEDWSYWCVDDPECEEILCTCEEIAAIRADERRWVTTSAAKEILNHRVQDGICACGIDAPNALEHLAWVLEVYVYEDLKPRHEVKA